MITRIKKDEKGLYVRCDGYLARYDSDVYGAIHHQPESKFKEGDSVSCTHPAGPSIYVKSKPDRSEKPETWKSEGAWRDIKEEK